MESVMLDESTVRDFTAYMKRFPELYEHLAHLMKRRLDCPHPVILDLGAGPGLLSKEILRQIPDAVVIAVDPSETMLMRAEDNIRQSDGGSFAAVRGVSEKIPLTQGTFDAIVSRFSLPYWQQPSQSFLEMHRVLKPGGIVVLEELNKEFPAWKLVLLKIRMMMRGASRKVAAYHVNAYPHAHTLEEVLRLFTDAGFTILEIEGEKKSWRFIVVAQKT